MSYYKYLDDVDVRDYLGVGEQGALLIQAEDFKVLKRIVDWLPLAFKGMDKTPIHSLVHFYRYVGVANYTRAVEGSAVLNDSSFDELMKTIVGDPMEVPVLRKDTTMLTK